MSQILLTHFSGTVLDELNEEIATWIADAEKEGNPVTILQISHAVAINDNDTEDTLFSTAILFKEDAPFVN